MNEQREADRGAVICYAMFDSDKPMVIADGIINKFKTRGYAVSKDYAKIDKNKRKKRRNKRLKDRVKEAKAQR